MKREAIIMVNKESAQIFKDFSKQYPEYMCYVERKAFIGIVEMAEFFVEISPELLAALSAYFVAKLQNTKKEIRIKKGELEIEIKDTNVTMEMILQLLEKLEQKK